jgi:hypothetical protein
MRETQLVCYRLTYNINYDAESVWSLVQRHQGYISVRPGGLYRFWVPREYSLYLVLAFPLLIREPLQDYYL